MDTDFKYVLKDQNALLERQAVALEKKSLKYSRIKASMLMELPPYKRTLDEVD